MWNGKSWQKKNYLMLKRIAVTGPESTGKTVLTQQLANFFHGNAVPEFSREYLLNIGKNYSLNDIVNIAKGQLKREEEIAEISTGFLFCDTDLLVTKIWAEEVFGTCPEWILSAFQNHRYDLYLLCYPDIPWEPDPLRENPSDRDRLFKIYEKTLQEFNMPYHIINGMENKRLLNAVNFVKKLL